MAKIGSYNWNFCTVGGVTRVKIETGEDIRHLGELDRKLWTVLSCPANGLEFDDKTLSFIDTDADGKIRVNEVIAAAQWLTASLRNPDLILQGSDSVSLADFNQDTEEGKQLWNNAKEILGCIKESKDVISLSDIGRCASLSDVKETTAPVLPWGDNTEAALKACEAIKGKVADYFVRCKMAAFDEGCTAALDFTAEKIKGISDKNLSLCSDEIAGFPLAHITPNQLLPLVGGINPAWEERFDAVKRLVFDVDYPGQTALSLQQWDEVLAKLDAYTTWKKAQVRVIPKYEPMEKFLYLLRDFYALLNNFVILANFYSKDKGLKAIFQAGTLYVDQRSCDLCLKVTDMSKHAGMVELSGLFLIYCECTSKVRNEKMTIVAAVTRGDVANLRVGKNAIFYDRQLQEWDATVVKVIDNPISLEQAFWSPYRKMSNFVSEQISKIAAEKDNKVLTDMTGKIDEGVKTVANPEKDKMNSKTQQAFDIAKFCGIFAAIGMAIGYIGSFFTSLFKGIFALNWWQLLLALCAIILIISGPSVFLAWSKLRKRNLSPILNANGWAINSKVSINIPFGMTLTGVCNLPKFKANDPFAKKGLSWQMRLLLWCLVLLIVVGTAYGVLYYMDMLGCIGL